MNFGQVRGDAMGLCEKSNGTGKRLAKGSRGVFGGGTGLWLGVLDGLCWLGWREDGLLFCRLGLG